MRTPASEPNLSEMNRRVAELESDLNVKGVIDVAIPFGETTSAEITFAEMQR